MDTSSSEQSDTSNTSDDEKSASAAPRSLTPNVSPVGPVAKVRKEYKILDKLGRKAVRAAIRTGQKKTDIAKDFEVTPKTVTRIGREVTPLSGSEQRVSSSLSDGENSASAASPSPLATNAPQGKPAIKIRKIYTILEELEKEKIRTKFGKGGYAITDAMHEFDIAKATAERLKAQATHAPAKRRNPPKPATRLTKTQKEEIGTLRASGTSASALAVAYNVSEKTIRNIYAKTPEGRAAAKRRRAKSIHPAKGAHRKHAAKSTKQQKADARQDTTKPQDKGKKRAHDGDGGALRAAPPGTTVRFNLRGDERLDRDAQREGYASLAPGEWLTDDVITDLFREWNTYNQNTPAAAGQDDVYFVTPAEMEMLGLGLHPVEPVDLAQIAGLLGGLTQRRLVLPINHGNRHWTIAEYDRATGEMHHADSALESDHGDAYTARAMEVLGNTHARDVHAQEFWPSRPEQGTFFNHAVPQQNNDYDCGVHLLGTGQGIQNRRNDVNVAFTLEDSIPFNRETLRERSAFSMVCDEINSGRDAHDSIRHDACTYRIDKDPGGSFLVIIDKTTNLPKIRIKAENIERANLGFTVEDFEKFKELQHSAKRSKTSAPSPHTGAPYNTAFTGPIQAAPGTIRLQDVQRTSDALLYTAGGQQAEQSPRYREQTQAPPRDPPNEDEGRHLTPTSRRDPRDAMERPRDSLPDRGRRGRGPR